LRCGRLEGSIMTNQDHNAIFITGSSSGLGRATAKLFASKGWKVIASMRDPKKEKELGHISGVTLMALDVTDPLEIESVAEQVVASGGVDVVFNNAGYVSRLRSKGLRTTRFSAW
jgi:NAD(P)-dependent dehydrogenase (short-subunit alcohol dehydrogenase family)